MLSELLLSSKGQIVNWNVHLDNVDCLLGYFDLPLSIPAHLDIDGREEEEGVVVSDFAMV